MAQIVHRAKHAASLGLIPANREVDLAKISNQIQMIIEQVAENEEAYIEGDTVKFGEVSFKSGRYTASRWSVCTIESALKAHDVVGGAFRICFNCDQWPYRLVTFTTNLRSRFGKVFTGDQAYFVRSTFFIPSVAFPNSH